MVESKGVPKLLPAVVIALIVLGIGLLWVTLGDSSGQDRPGSKIMRQVDCDKFDLGDGSVTLLCMDGRDWTCTPFELGPEAQ